METHSEKYEMLTVFLIYADLRLKKDNESAVNKLRKEQDELFRHLRTCTLHEQHKIVILINTIKFYKPQDTDPDKIDITRLMVVEPKKSTVNKRKNEIVPVIHEGRKVKFGTPNMLQKADVLGELFGIIQDHYPARQRMLITWDHGSAFGINRVDKDEVPAAAFKISNLFYEGFRFDQPELIVHKPANGSFVRFWEQPFIISQPAKKAWSGVATGMQADVAFSDKESGISLVKKRFLGVQDLLSAAANGSPVNAATAKIDDILENGELAEAIEKGFGGPIDLVVMMNCMMMNFHTVYSLARAARYLVAPQGRIDKPAYDYRAIINSINQCLPGSPDMKGIVRFVIESSFKKERSAHDNGGTISVDPDEAEEIERWALFGIMMDRVSVEEIGTLVNAFARCVVKGKRKRKLQKLFGRTRSKCFEFSQGLNYYQVDLLTFMENNLRYFKGESYLKPLFDIKGKVHTRWTAMKVASGIGKDPYFVENGALFNDFKSTPSGLSVYFPEALPQGRTLTDEYRTFVNPHAKSQCAFLREKTNWLRLLNWMKKPKPYY